MNEFANERDRVKKLFIDPLSDIGFRFRNNTAPEIQKKYMAGISDGLKYMTDAGLKVLAESMSTKGDGSLRTFWPSRATVLGFAEVFEPRPLELSPGVASWFGSKAGQNAVKMDRLVVEFCFWQKFKRPPRDDRDWSRVNAKAADYRRRLELAADRSNRGVRLDPDEVRFVNWYWEIHERAEALVRAAA